MNIDIGRRRGVGSKRFHGALACCIAMLLMGVLVLSGCEKGGRILGKESIKNVVTVDSDVGSLRAWTAHKARAAVLITISPTDDVAAFPPEYIQDMKNAAAHLKRGNEQVLDQAAPFLDHGGVVNLGYMAGMYRRVIWVVPSLRPVSDTSPDVYRDYYLKARKLPENAVGVFRVQGNEIVGSVTGIPITITRSSDLKLEKDENAIVDINLTYFPARQSQDASFRPGMKTLLAFLRELADKGIKASIVTVNLASQSDLMPMDLRYFGHEIKEALTDPSGLMGQMPAKWQMMMQAEDSLRAQRYAAAAGLYSEIAKKTTDDPGVYFGLAMASGFQDKGAECRAALLSAYAIDPGYLRGFFQLARVLGDAGKVEAGKDLLETPDLEKLLSPLDLQYQKGVFFYSAHRPGDALSYLEAVAAQRKNDFGLYSVIFRAYREKGDRLGQMDALRQLITIDNGRVKREMPWVYADLGQLYEKADSLASAAKMYESYMQVHPDDSLASVFRKKIKLWSAKGFGKTKH